MTTEAEAADTIQSTILGATLTGISDKSAQIAWPGLPFDEDIETPYIRVWIQNTDRNQLTFGAAGGTRKFRQNGNLIVQCFIPAKDGSMTDARNLAVEVKNLFEGNTLATVRFIESTIREAPSEPTWIQANAEIVFQYDEQK